jgi:hypothetical protein
MPIDDSYECDYCGKTNDNQNEKCTKCGKYKNESPDDFQKHLDTIEDN